MKTAALAVVVVPISLDRELRISVMPDPARRGNLLLELVVWSRPSGSLHALSAASRIPLPLHLAEALAVAIREVGLRAAQAALWAPPEEVRRAAR